MQAKTKQMDCDSVTSIDDDDDVLAAFQINSDVELSDCRLSVGLLHPQSRSASVGDTTAGALFS